jgi:hypothetical protein
LTKALFRNIIRVNIQTTQKRRAKTDKYLKPRVVLLNGCFWLNKIILQRKERTMINAQAKADWNHWIFRTYFLKTITSLKLIRGEACEKPACKEEHLPSQGPLPGPCPSQKCIKLFARICYDIGERKVKPTDLFAGKIEPYKHVSKEMLEHMDYHLSNCKKENACSAIFDAESDRVRMVNDLRARIVNALRFRIADILGGE